VRAVPEVLAERNPKGTWARVRAIGLALTQQHTGTASHERRYSVLRGTPSVPRGAHAVRGHGGIENCLHWVFDVTFDEERSRVRRGNAAQNFAVLRHSALNLLRHEPSTGSIKTKPVRAALDAHSLRTGVQP
jgi:uncharacterized protein YbdZ (MbtH family)